tara:strand:- start:3319 stop:4311 length:993 start_codon:yes stop_codon:yes gene_type:complete
VKILVTGGAGFIGQRIVRQLMDKNHDVTVIGRSTKPEDESICFHRIDIANEPVPDEVCRGMDAIFHVAAKAGIWGASASYESANVFGTQRILDLCRKHDIQYLIHTSTPSVVFTGQPFRGENEGLPYGRNWLCHYARTKAIAEREVLDANEIENLKTIALRPHLVWGSGDPHLIPKVLSKARAGKLRMIGDGSNQVDLTHVDNAAHAHLLALDALVSGAHPGGKAYFISQGEPIALWPWLNNLLGRLGAAPVRRRISLRKAYAMGFLLECAWKVLGLESDPPMTRFVAIQLGKDHWFDDGAARRDIGYQPIVSMDEGLDETVAWLQSIGR